MLGSIIVKNFKIQTITPLIRRKLKIILVNLKIKFVVGEDKIKMMLFKNNGFTVMLENISFDGMNA
jgi:hypothetical protein